MLVRFWGTRGSLPVAQTAPAIRAKIARALVDAGGRRFADEAEAARFADSLDFATSATYGGASRCVHHAPAAMRLSAGTRRAKDRLNSRSTRRRARSSS